MGGSQGDQVVMEKFKKKQKQTHRYRAQTHGCRGGEVVGGTGEEGEGIKKCQLAITE